MNELALISLKKLAEFDDLKIVSIKTEKGKLLNRPVYVQFLNQSMFARKIEFRITL